MFEYPCALQNVLCSWLVVQLPPWSTFGKEVYLLLLKDLPKYISRSVVTKAVQMDPPNLLMIEMMQSIESSI